MATKEEKSANKQAWGTKVQNLICKEITHDFDCKMKQFIASGVTLGTCKTDANKLKCRYADVLCIDQTRVVLKNRSKDEDFIHANWVASPESGATKYICTQAPLKATQEDFWQMCFTEKASLILMLCNFKEGSEMEKCSHYFPEKPGENKTFGPYTVTMKEKLDEPEIDDTDFSVMEIKCKDETVKLKHCFTRVWPSGSAPMETESILKLWRWVRKHHSDRPVVVHCSAGVGRASTFVGIELASHRIASNPDMRIVDIVKELRQQRAQSIQSRVQFLYLHALVLDYFVQEKIVAEYHDSGFVRDIKRQTLRRNRKASVSSSGESLPASAGNYRRDRPGMCPAAERD